jgi:DNA-binding IclR family transcriptional regulator
MTPDLRTAFFTLQAAGTATASVLAERVGWTVTRAVEVLETLLRLRLIRSDEGRYAVPLGA